MSLPTITIEVMFTSPTWTDVTQWAKHGITTRRGSSRVESPIIRYEAGTAVVQLDNSDRRFDPTNLSGPYVSGGKTLVSCMFQSIANRCPGTERSTETQRRTQLL